MAHLYSLVSSLYRKIAVVVGLLLTISPGALAQAQEDATVSRIIEAWRKRQDVHRYVLCEWEETRNEVEGVDQIKLNYSHRLRLADEALESRSVGDQWRSIGDGDPALRSAERVWVKLTRSVAFDGKELLRVFAYDRRLTPEATPRSGFRSKEYDDKGNIHLAAIMLHVRPLASVFHEFDAKDLKVVRDEAVESDGLIHLRAKKCDLLVDPRAEFIVREYLRRHNDKLIEKLEITYGEKTDQRTKPVAWSYEYLYHEGGVPRFHGQGKVTRYEVDTPAAREPVSMEVPPETMVRGEGDDDFLRLPNGKWRTVGRNERIFSPTYEELRDSEPGKAIPQHFLDLHAKMQPIGKVGVKARIDLLTEFKKYIQDQPPLRRHRELAVDTARRLFNSEQPEAAVEMCRAFSKLDKHLANLLEPLAKEFEQKLPPKPQPKPIS
jgi:hypothetical protein